MSASRLRLPAPEGFSDVSRLSPRSRDKSLEKIANLKESWTSSSITAKKAQIESSDSRRSFSKNEKLLTFNSSSQSRLRNYSVVGKNDEDDFEAKHDMDSVVGVEGRQRRSHAATEMDADETDSEFADDNDGDGRNFNTRKFSVETVIGGTEDRFCLSSNAASRHEATKNYLSPMKLLAKYGPRSDNKPGGLSPSLAISTTGSIGRFEATTDEQLDGLKDKYRLTKDEILSSDLEMLELKSEILSEDLDAIAEMRGKLLDIRQKEDIFSLIDDYPEKFKKTEK